MENKLDFSGFEPLNTYIVDCLEKTAAEKAGENLAYDAYACGLEAGLGIDSSYNMAKVACEAVGREAMMDFVPGLFLSK